MSREKIWVPVPGHEGMYEVSNDGEVKSLARFVEKIFPGGRVVKQWYGENILKPAVDERGYLRVSLYNGGKSEKKRQVQGIVLTAFAGPRPAGMDCCHNDGNPGNNKLENLRWDTRKNNMADAKKHGSIVKGATHFNSKWSKEDREEIISMCPSDAENKFGCSRSSHLRLRREMGKFIDRRVHRYA